MNTLFYLDDNSPTSLPTEFEFEGKTWNLWPYDTYGISRLLERWVVKFVTQNVEALRPDDKDEDIFAWRIYNESKKLCQENIERGNYGVGTDGFVQVINSTDAGYAEALHQCLSWKQPDWTRELTKKIWNTKKEDITKLWLELNFKKKL
jgi:hypothetical protein